MIIISYNLDNPRSGTKDNNKVKFINFIKYILGYLTLERLRREARNERLEDIEIEKN